MVIVAMARGETYHLCPVCDFTSYEDRCPRCGVELGTLRNGDISKLMVQGRGIRKLQGRGTNNTHKKNTKELDAKDGVQEGKTLVIKDENLRGGFTQVPNVVLTNSALSSNAVRLYALLLSYAWQSDQCFPGQQLLSSHMGCKKNTITRTLAELRKVKLISWKRQGLGKVNIYYIEKLSDGYIPKQLVD